MKFLTTAVLALSVTIQLGAMTTTQSMSSSVAKSITWGNWFETKIDGCSFTINPIKIALNIGHYSWSKTKENPWRTAAMAIGGCLAYNFCWKTFAQWYNNQLELRARIWNEIAKQCINKKYFAPERKQVEEWVQQCRTLPFFRQDHALKTYVEKFYVFHNNSAIEIACENIRKHLNGRFF